MNVNSAKCIYLFLKGFLTILNYNTVKCFEGKRSLYNNVKWLNATNDPEKEGIEKHGKLESVQEQMVLTAVLYPWVIISNYDTPEALSN